MRLLVLFFVPVLIVGCNRNAPAPQIDGKGKDHVHQGDGGNELPEQKTQDPLAAELAAMKPVEPVPFEKLQALLPPAPAGYKAEEPRGESIELGEYKHSYAERKYTKGDKNLDVKIHDCAQIKELYLSIQFASTFKVRNSEGHHLGVTIDGNPGIEQYKKADQSGELTVLVGKRHFVVITADGIQPAFLRTVYNSIDTKKLAALK